MSVLITVSMKKKLHVIIDYQLQEWLQQQHWQQQWAVNAENTSGTIEIVDDKTNHLR